MAFLLTRDEEGMDFVRVSLIENPPENPQELAQKLGGIYDPNLDALLLPAHLFVPLTPENDPDLYGKMQTEVEQGRWTGGVCFYKQEEIYVLESPGLLRVQGCGYIYLTAPPVPELFRNDAPAPV